MTPPKQAVLIIRVSDPRQEREGLSLDNQEQALRRYAEETGLAIAKEFRFQETADLKIRNRFREVIAFAKKHPEVRAIIGYRVDRMTRNFHDHVLLDDLRLNHNKELHFVHDRLVITRATVGREIQDWDTKVYLAKMYLNRLREDATISAAYKVSRGEWPGKAPFGLENTKLNNRSWIEPHQPEAEVVVFCFEKYATGAFSMEQVRADVQRKFGVVLSKGKLDWVLKNRFYYGEMVFKGERHPHNYEPLISRSLYERVMAVKEAFHKSSYKFAGLPYLYRGLIKCAECGCAITPERKKKKGGKTYVYYHCTNYHKRHSVHWVREEELTKQFLAHLHKLRIPEAELTTMVATLRESHDAKVRYATKARQQFTAEREKLQRRIEVLYEDRLDGLISKETYGEQKHRYEQQVRDTEARLTSLSGADETYYETSALMLEVCAGAEDYFRDSPDEQKRVMLKMALQNCSLKEKTLLCELKSPFDTVFQHASRQMWLPLLDAFRNKELKIGMTAEDVQAVRIWFAA